MMLDNHDLFDAIRLTPSQRAAVKWIRGLGGSVTAKHTASHFVVNQTQASATLKACVTKGYLVRTNKGDPTGGQLWLYSYAL
tara:strand:+ start:5488 stop:5733 length:246 start_codon:yes stop_codon:yes gene_type:complete